MKRYKLSEHSQKLADSFKPYERLAAALVGIDRRLGYPLWRMRVVYVKAMFRLLFV